MTTPPESPRWLPDDSTVPVFAAVGGAVLGVLADDGITRGRAIAMVVAGVLLGAFVAPGVVEWCGITNLKLVSTVSCVVGMLGLQAVRVVTQQFDGMARRALAVAARRAGLDDREPPGA